MPLSYTELCELVDQGVITGVTPDRINAASIDLTLGDTIWEEGCHQGWLVDLAAKPREFPAFCEYKIDSDDGFVLLPGRFILAATNEYFNLPNYISADYRLNSSLARAGLNAALAMWCDPGWHGAQLTLELKNWLQFHPLLLRKNMKIGQAIFHRVTPVPEERSYKVVGSYNHTQGPSVRG